MLLTINIILSFLYFEQKIIKKESMVFVVPNEFKSQVVLEARWNPFDSCPFYKLYSPGKI